MNQHTPVTANYSNRGHSNQNNGGCNQPHHAPSNQHGCHSNVMTLLKKWTPFTNLLQIYMQQKVNVSTESPCSPSYDPTTRMIFVSII